jgi:hypothetical protein
MYASESAISFTGRNAQIQKTNQHQPTGLGSALIENYIESKKEDDSYEKTKCPSSSSSSLSLNEPEKSSETFNNSAPTTTKSGSSTSQNKTDRSSQMSNKSAGSSRNSKSSLASSNIKLDSIKPLFLHNTY